MKSTFVSRNGRLLAGVLTVLALFAIVAVTLGLFTDSFNKGVPVTVVADRAGLVMYPNAKVKMNGAPVGKVKTIEALPEGGAALHLAIDRDSIGIIPSNVDARITSSTVFGSKYVELIPPAQPSPETLQAGAVIEGGNKVQVELNTVFEKLVGVLQEVEPAKLNETLGTISTSLNGRGDKFGRTLVGLDSALAKINPSLGNLNRALDVAPPVFDALADSSPDLLAVVANTTQLGDTIVAERDNLDALLMSAIGVADVGTEVLGDNRQQLADVLHLLVPTTDLTNQYHRALTCGLGAMLPLANGPGLPGPGAFLLQGFFLGRERYRYPGNLPKVAAKGGPQCTDLPNVGYERRPPYVVTDIGANQAQYGNQGILLNSDGLKQLLFGPIDGPPRNSAQIGMPG